MSSGGESREARDREASGAGAAGQLHAPWRLSYLELLGREQADARPADPAGAAGGSCASFLREYWEQPARDAANHVIVRTGKPGTSGGGLILLNRYPYANGHLLACLGEPRMRLLEYSERERAELWSLVDLAVDLCERALRCQGVNVGLNQGAAAGAGIPGHLHIHIVPRWAGDVNFMTVVGQVRVIPSALEDMARRYREVWEAVRPGPRGD